MREHKYRVWDKKRKRMITEGLSFSYDYEEGINSIYDEQGRIIEEPEVLDWTGLFDKNKKPIYEGDIVKFDNLKFHGFDKEFSGETRIRYCSGGFSFFDVGGNLSPCLYNVVPFTKSFETKIEVIGNIYEKSGDD